jgi:2-polyprenyl-3-methyl-5-hydroxy-6-metoxy-1,4-benzoquinol methylase
MINSRGYWEDNTISNHKHDSILNEELLKYFKEIGVKSILDLGCGPGDYSKNFIDNGFECDCFDGNPNTAELSKGLCGILDLSEPVYLNKTYDCVLSLEVGEHIPTEYESIFINNVVRHSKDLIILSWATIGQGGHGHFNEKPNEYIESVFYEYNFKRDFSVENRLRLMTEWWWFRNTVMVFKK